MNCTATPTTTPTPPILAEVETSAKSDGFAEAVHDILIEVTAVTRDSIGAVRDQIVDAYVPRMKLERERTAQALAQIRGLISRDRMLHEHLGQMRRSLDKINNSQVRYAAAAADLRAKVDAVRALLRRTEEAGLGTVTLTELTEALGADAQMPRFAPTPVSFVAGDTRWQVGYFAPSGGRKRVSMPFVGWSVVLRPTVPDSLIEPVFLVDGTATVQSELARRGYSLERIM